MSYKEYFSIEQQLHKEGVTDTRSEHVSRFTKKRTEHLSALSKDEYSNFIHWLRDAVLKPAYFRNVGMRRKIIAMFHKMGYQVEGKIDMPHLNEWCRTYGHLHKDLSGYVGNDLVKLVTQAEKYYKSYIKRI